MTCRIAVQLVFNLHLYKIKDTLMGGEYNLRHANDKADALTIKNSHTQSHNEGEFC